MLEGDKSVEISRGEAKWSTQDWRSYLLALAHNTRENDYSLPYQSFPKEIELSDAWHETFDAMRRETAADGHERWGLIASTQARDRVFISQTFVRAQKDPHVILGRDIQTATSKARERGLWCCIGDVHTHPQEPNRFGASLRRRRADNDEFSALDLYAVLTGDNPLSVLFLVGPTENRLACRSKETRYFPIILDQHNFDALWAQQIHNKAERNLAITRQHHLVLYGGKPDQPMQRIFPRV